MLLLLSWLSLVRVFRSVLLLVWMIVLSVVLVIVLVVVLSVVMVVRVGVVVLLPCWLRSWWGDGVVRVKQFVDVPFP